MDFDQAKLFCYELHDRTGEIFAVVAKDSHTFDYSVTRIVEGRPIKPSGWPDMFVAGELVPYCPGENDYELY